MNLRLLICLCLLPSLLPAQPVDDISQDAVQAAFRILRRDYIRREDLTLDQLNRAALQGLLQRLAFGASIVRTPQAETSKKSNIVAEVITPKVAYLRPFALSADEFPLVERAMVDFESKGISQLILDLRQPAAPGTLETAAALAELFLPRGELLFKLKQLGAGESQLFLSKREPIWRATVVLLVDGDSNNVGETLAAIFKQKKRALLVGSKTLGATVRYNEVPLEDGWRLRFAAAEVLLADDHSVFRRGVEPDFKVEVDKESKDKLMRHAAGKTVKDLVFENQRSRFNERALVNWQNPELDDYVSRTAGKSMPYDTPPPLDKVLQRAVDLLQTSELVGRVP
jgi:hypothetical protein